VQLIISGDFFQLPPVPDIRDGLEVPSTFAFDAKSWPKCVGHPVFLTKVFRQDSQSTCFRIYSGAKARRYLHLAFVNLLNNIRYNKLCDLDLTHLRSLSRPLAYEDGVEPTELCVYQLNEEKIDCEVSLLGSHFVCK
jgi:ATP-dependent DNA helicase PIF1